MQRKEILGKHLSAALLGCARRSHRCGSGLRATAEKAYAERNTKMHVGADYT